MMMMNLNHLTTRGCPGGLIKKRGALLEAIGSESRFFLTIYPRRTYTKVYKNEKKISSNSMFIIFFHFVSYKINKHGVGVVEPI
jgi:hypothetical protein